MNRPCSNCGALTTNTPARCDTCKAATPKRQRPSRTARGYGHTWRKLRLTILDRDAHRCYLCGQHATTVDHITPKTRGGTDDPGNLAACCRTCQNRKGDQAPRRLA